MAYKQVLLGDYFKFEKGLGYKGEFLADESDVGLIGIDSQIPGGGYKKDSEKPYSGPFKPEHVVDSGDVIVAATDITQDGSVLGSTLMVPETTSYETLIYSGDVMRAIPLLPEVFNLEYFYNLYRVEKYRKILAYGDSGTTVRRIASENLAEQLVPLPDLSAQLAINEIISLIDQHISNNSSLSKNLELLAQSIFKSWFIDFDPVHAKSRGEKPFGMDDETAALFPDSFEESELGIIPKGWKISTATDVFDVLSGGTPKTTIDSYWNGDVPWFSVVDAPDNGGCFFIKTSKNITKEGLDNSAAKLVRPGVTIISARGTVGKTAIVAIPSTFNQSCYGIQGKYGDYFTYLLLQNLILKLQSIAHGGVFDTITRETFSVIEVVKADIAVIERFEFMVSPIFLEILNLQLQSENLASLRDSLLPRLISGELQIPEELLVT